MGEIDLRTANLVLVKHQCEVLLELLLGMVGVTFPLKGRELQIAKGWQRPT
jgi:hypothetical protein